MERFLTVRVSDAEAAALDQTAKRLHMPRSVVVRAGVAAIVRDPRLVWAVRLSEEDAWEPGPVPGELRPPPPPSKRGKRGKRR